MHNLLKPIYFECISEKAVPQDSAYLLITLDIVQMTLLFDNTILHWQAVLYAGISWWEIRQNQHYAVELVVCTVVYVPMIACTKWTTQLSWTNRRMYLFLCVTVAIQNNNSWYDVGISVCVYTWHCYKVSVAISAFLLLWATRAKQPCALFSPGCCTPLTTSP